tara:strand:- start:153 stop:308 length:156 start_codon:yes stop_codon:yes gene_type:complete
VIFIKVMCEIASKSKNINRINNDTLLVKKERYETKKGIEIDVKFFFHKTLL